MLNFPKNGKKPQRKSFPYRRASTVIILFISSVVKIKIYKSNF
jgi:hypothetical protein